MEEVTTICLLLTIYCMAAMKLGLRQLSMVFQPHKECMKEIGLVSEPCFQSFQVVPVTVAIIIFIYLKTRSLLKESYLQEIGLLHLSWRVSH